MSILIMILLYLLFIALSVLWMKIRAEKIYGNLRNRQKMGIGMNYLLGFWGASAFVFSCMGIVGQFYNISVYQVPVDYEFMGISLALWTLFLIGYSFFKNEIIEDEI